MQRITQFFRPKKTWESQVAQRLLEFSFRNNTSQMLFQHNEDAKIVYKRLKALAKQIQSYVSDRNLFIVSSGMKQTNADAIINDLEQALHTRSAYSNCVCIKTYGSKCIHVHVHVYQPLYI